MTALWMVIGAISEQILKKHNICIGSHIASLKDVEDVSFNQNVEDLKQLVNLNSSVFPVIDPNKEKAMRVLIEDAKSKNDAVGGIVETKAINLPIGFEQGFPTNVQLIAKRGQDQHLLAAAAQFLPCITATQAETKGQYV